MSNTPAIHFLQVVQMINENETALHHAQTFMKGCTKPMNKLACLEMRDIGNRTWLECTNITHNQYVTGQLCSVMSGGQEGKLSGLFCAVLCATIVHSELHTHMNIEQT